MIREGQLGVAVSGGADSVALLHLLAEAGFPITVLHVNHGFRGTESEGDQEFVSHTAARLGLPLLVHRPALEGGNVEQAARRARYQWFHELIKAGVVCQIATGHTQDDQAETVLFRFLRGAGTAGLAAVRPEVDGIVRPLLAVRRADLRSYLGRRNIGWREDSSNRMLSFRRNRIRHELLPALEADWNPNLTASLAQTAEWARDEESYWHAELARIAANWVRFSDGQVSMATDWLASLPVAVARRIIRLAAQHVQGDLRQVTFPQVERVRLLAGGQFRTARWGARQSAGQLRISGVEATPAPYRLAVQAPGVYPLPEQAATLHLELNFPTSVYNSDGQKVDWALVSGSVELRSWQPGDRFRPAGHQTSRKLKKFFQEAGIPSWERLGWPVLTCNNSIFWTRGLGVAAEFLPSPATRDILLVYESSNQNVSK